MDNFFDVRRDIEADVATVRALGYRSIQWCGSALPFATREEAESNARDLMMRWCAVRGDPRRRKRCPRKLPVR